MNATISKKWNTYRLRINLASVQYFICLKIWTVFSSGINNAYPCKFYTLFRFLKFFSTCMDTHCYRKPFLLLSLGQIGPVLPHESLRTKPREFLENRAICEMSNLLILHTPSSSISKQLFPTFNFITDICTLSLVIKGTSQI